MLSFFQNKVFEQSVLPDLSGALTAGVLLSLLAGDCGLPAGIWFFSKTEKTGAAGQSDGIFRKINRFCLKGFYLTDFYQAVFVRLFMALAEFAWRFAAAELLTEKLPGALKKTAENLQKVHSGRPYDFLIWSLTGLFVLIFSLLLLLAGE